MTEADLTHVKLQQELANKSSSYYEQANGFASIAKCAFKNRRQLRSLETLAFRAHSPVDVFAFIKSQTGKAGENKGWRYENFGPDLVTTLDTTLKEEAKEIASNIYGDTQAVQYQMHVHLELVRLYIRYLVSNYLYHITPDDEIENGED